MILVLTLIIPLNHTSRQLWRLGRVVEEQGMLLGSKNKFLTSYKQLFSTRKYPRFLSIESTTGADLTKLNMFKVDREITAYVGECHKISEDFNNKSWTVEVKK